MIARKTEKSPPHTLSNVYQRPTSDSARNRRIQMPLIRISEYRSNVYRCTDTRRPSVPGHCSRWFCCLKGAAVPDNPDLRHTFVPDLNIMPTKTTLHTHRCISPSRAVSHAYAMRVDLGKKNKKTISIINQFWFIALYTPAVKWIMVSSRWYCTIIGGWGWYLNLVIVVFIS